MYNTFMTKTEEMLEKKGIENNFQLRRWLPRSYVDYSVATGCMEGSVVCVGVMLSCEKLKSQKDVGYIYSRVQDLTTNLIFKVIIFNQPYAFNTYHDFIGKNVLVCGEMKYEYGSYKIVGPAVFTDDVENNKRVLPIYPKVAGTKPFYVRKKIYESCLEGEEDSLPSDFKKKHNLAGISWSLYELHNPSSYQNLKKAEERLLYEDMFYFAALNELVNRKDEPNCAPMANVSLCMLLTQRFGYALTPDQQSAFFKISSYMTNGQHLRALVQGDVGCGKTIIAFLAMAQAVGSGKQAILMAPTKVLAEQHANQLKKLLPEYEDKIYYAGGKAPLKKDLKKIETGEYLFIVGTHALISEKVHYKDPGIVVIDEEHKFGVDQRSAFEKQKKGIHSISMSATPIPRTLAKTIYGDGTEVFIIRTKPNGRKPVFTVYDNGDNIPLYVRTALSRNEQVYVVCPAIEVDDEKMEGVVSVKDAAEKYASWFPDINIGILNGKMSAADTKKVLDDFKNGVTRILISTTVVEVGVDVPNATLIVLQNAERFGLAGMHQLRGRVGRGSKQSCCMLISAQENPRIHTLCSTTDGFEIAKMDLEMRKSGSLFGLEQSGFNKYVQEIIDNNEVYEKVRTEVKDYSVIMLNRHIKKMQLCHNQKRQILFGNGGFIDELTESKNKE